MQDFCKRRAYDVNVAKKYISETRKKHVQKLEFASDQRIGCFSANGVHW